MVACVRPVHTCVPTCVFISNLGAKPRVPGFKHDAAERPFKGGMDDSDAEDAPFASAASTSSSAAATAGETDGAAWARTLNDDGGFSWGKRRSCPEWPGSGAVAVWRVPLVRDVLRFVAQHKLLVVLDVKEVRRVDEAIAQLHELLRQYDLYPRTLLSAFDPAILLAGTGGLERGWGGAGKGLGRVRPWGEV